MLSARVSATREDAPLRRDGIGAIPVSYSLDSGSINDNTRREHGVSSPPRLLVELLEGTGVNIDGNDPCDIQVHDTETYRRILTRGTLGFGEAYMDGLRDCQQLDSMLARLHRAGISERVCTLPRLRVLLSTLASVAGCWLIHHQSRRREFRIGEHHYDFGNELFEAMLDSTLSYSCGYWARAGPLSRRSATGST
jgi:cyclopropane-fatty-acyl-phospholipid synthase